MKKYLLAVVFLCLSFLSYSDGTEVLDQDTNTGVITQAKDFDKVKGKSKKQIFIDTLIPTIEKIRDKVEADKQYVISLIEKEILTDACKIFVIKGKDVALAKGEYSNLKITTVTDLKIAKSMIEKD